MKEQRLLEKHSTKKRPDVGHILSFCVLQSTFRARWKNYRVSVFHNVAFACSTPDFHAHCVLDLPTNDCYCASARNSFLSNRGEIEPGGNISVSFVLFVCATMSGALILCSAVSSLILASSR